MTRLHLLAASTAFAATVAAFGFGWRPTPQAKHAEYEVLKPVTYKNMTIYPVVPAGERDQKSLASRYITLDEGLKKGLIVITEMGSDENIEPLHRGHPQSGGTNEFGYRQAQQQSRQGLQSSGQVNSLALVNKSGKQLILLAGEMVVGGNQDRIVQKDAMVAPNARPIPLAVFCVEHGRWENQTVKFGNQIGGSGGFGGGLADPSVRGTAQSKADQSAVWGAVAAKGRALGGESRTGTYQTIVTSPKALKDTSDYIKAIDGRFPVTRAIGAIVAINGKLVWADVFTDRADLFAKYWPKLLRSYALDAISSPPPPNYEREQWTDPSVVEAREFLHDRSGTANFEGTEDIYKLRRTESKAHVIYDLIDIGLDTNLNLHTCKMLKK